ncbi:hypothetical protein ACFY12_00125 [Streptomyces sp. NPDC001339]|uniref:hypothetical protein n=1 Tax=Streptomyces sp. NPDC001339 TaxID=3364563 RepID=UPI0036842D7F
MDQTVPEEHTAHAKGNSPGVSDGEMLASLSDWITPDAPEIHWEVPEEFHSLGLEYVDEQHEKYLELLAARVWPGGSDQQRDLITMWYSEVAATATQAGAAYAGFCILATDDDRVSTASLTIRCEPLDSTAASQTADALLEALSSDASLEVHRVETNCGPAVISISGTQVIFRASGSANLPAEQEPSAPAPPISLAQIDAYCPLPEVERLLVFSLSTPSFAELPWYIAKLSELVDTVELSSPERHQEPVTGLQHGKTPADHHQTLPVQDVFG